MLETIIGDQIFQAILVFARLGSAIMLFPGLGDSFINARARLALAVLMAILVTPVVASLLPTQPESLGDMLGMIMIEVITGLFMGAAVKVLFSAVSITGSFIAMYTGLASAMMFNPSLDDQGSLISVFYSLLAVLLLFATDLHHLLLRATVESYMVFVPAVRPPVGDMADVMAKVTTESFRLALHLSAPFVLVMVLMYTILGVMSRLMPQLQIFFIGLPMQLLLGILVMMITVGGMMSWFLGQFTELVKVFLALD